MIIYCIITAFINAVTSLVLGIAVLLHRPRSAPNVPFFLFALAATLWSGCYLMWQISGDAGTALWWTRGLSAVAIFIPPTFFHFVLRLVGSDRSRMLVAGYLMAGALSALSFTSLISAGVAPAGGFPNWPKAGVLYPAYVLVFGTYTIVSWSRLLEALRKASHARRNQLRFVFWGTTAGFVGGATNFPLWFGIDIPPIGNGLAAFYVVGVAYAIIRFRLLEVNYVVTKMVAYLLAALPLALIYPGIFFLLKSITHGELNILFAWLLASLVLAFVAFLSLPILKRRLDSLLEMTLLKPFVSGRQRLRELSFAVGNIRDEAEMFKYTAEAVGEALAADAAFYLRGELDAAYRLRACATPAGAAQQPKELEENDPVLSLVRREQRAVLLDEFATLEPGSWPLLSAAKQRRRIEVAVPVLADSSFFGLLELGVRRHHRVYSDADLALLDSVCLQIGLHIRARQLERRANQTEKLISLGTLAAGLAHELRNPLVSIKTFAALLGEHPDDREFQQEFSATVLRDVGRIESIVENVSAFATDRKVAFSWIRLEEVVRAAYEIARPSFVAAGVRFVFEPGELPLVHGNHNQLTQVVLNLLNNAVQALQSSGDGVVNVAIKLRGSETRSRSVELAISDNGPGVDPEVLPRLFEPFTTTKDTGDRSRTAGMGLGLAIVKRIVDGHNGVIRVDSERGRGTTFTVVLTCEAAD